MDGLVKWFDLPCLPAVPSGSLNVWLPRRTNVTSWSKLQVEFWALGLCRASLHGLGCVVRLLTCLFLQWAVSSPRTGAPHLWNHTWSGVRCSWTERGSWNVWAIVLGIPSVCFHQTFSVNTPSSLWLPRPSETCCPGNSSFWGLLSLC